MDSDSHAAVGQYARIYNSALSGSPLVSLTPAEQAEISTQANGNTDLEKKLTNEALAQKSDELGVGTFALTDIRDNKDYLVRRLADGNCWMVQNLDLELADFVGKDNTNGGLTPANTDIYVAYWDPGKTTADKAYAIDPTVDKDDQTSYFPVTSINYVGIVQTKQFQSYNISTIWDTYCEAIGECNTEVTPFAHSILTEIPRSYSTMITNDQSTDFDSATAFPYVATNWSTGLVRDQAKAQDSDYPSAAPTMYDNGVATSLTSTATYMPTARAQASTGSAGAAYESTADGTYYGNMYIGHYYNWYAATAETGTYNMSNDDKIAKGSICPSGWELPTGKDETQVEYKRSFGNLLSNTYRIVSQWGIQTDDNTPQGNAYAPQVDMHKLPISIANTGGYSFAAGVPSSRALNAYYWEDKEGVADNSNALFAQFNSLSIIARHVYLKVNGYSIRCVARGTENQVTPPADVVESTCAANSICYDSNGGSGSMNPTTNAIFGSSKVLSAPTFTRTGYAFVGWSESKNAEADGAYIYGPNETINVPNLSSEGMTLYAQWLAPINSSYTMQAFGKNETVKTCSTTTDGHTALAEHERIALRDVRDDNVYVVTKLKDGNCWMTSNLALNLAEFAGTQKLTPANTDLNSSEAITRGYWDPSTDSNYVSLLKNDPSISAFYTWYAALATKGDSSSDSICPAGWGVNDSNSTKTTYQAYNVDELSKSPINLTESGVWRYDTEIPYSTGYSFDMALIWEKNAANTSIGLTMAYNLSTAQSVTYERWIPKTDLVAVRCSLK